MTQSFMNKGDLVALIAKDGDCSKAEAERSLDMVTSSIIHALEKGQDIRLVGFGSFHIKKREAREGRNPKTGEKMLIAAYKQPIFKAGKGMKDACN